MTDEQILEKIEKFLDAPIGDAVIKNFFVDIVKRNENKNDSGMLSILMISALGYCQSGREIQGVDLSNMKLSDLAKPDNLNKIKLVMTDHRLGKDFAACSSFIMNAFGNKMMDISFDDWGKLARRCAIMAYKIGTELDDSKDYERKEDEKQENDIDDNFANELRSILGDL